MKKLFDLRMKEGTNITGHLNEFNIIFLQLTAQGLNFGEEVRCIFLLCSLPSSWDTFCTAVSNSAPATRFVFNDVIGNLLTEEIHRNSLELLKGDAYVASGKQRGRTHDRAKDKDRKGARSKSRESSRNVECYHCHKKGYLKKECRTWLRENKKRSDEKKPETHNKDKSSVEIKELNVVESSAMSEMQLPSYVLIFTADLCPDALVIEDANYAQNWIIDSGASFHVTPHADWFSTYVQARGTVKLGDAYELDILGIGDIKFNGTEFILRDVRHVPKLTQSLIYAGQLDNLGYSTTFGNGSWVIKKGNLVILKDQKHRSLYSMFVLSVKEDYISIAEMPTSELWHKRLGHMSQKGMKVLTRFGYLPVLTYDDFAVCEHCFYGKHTRAVHKALDREKLQA